MVLPKCRWLPAVLFIAGVLLEPLLAHSQDMFDADQDDELTLLADDLPAEWWDRKWRWRRKIVAEGADLRMSPGGIVFLPQPDPLLLYNTGRCAELLADVRIIDWAGKALPSGVCNFGRDDGSSYLWFKPGNNIEGTRAKLYLYYGNPAANAPRERLPPGLKIPANPALSVVLGREEELPGAEPAATKPTDFFAGVVSVEAESVVSTPKQAKAAGLRITRGKAASAGALLERDPRAKDKPPSDLTAAVQLPAGGEWTMHLRYRAATASRGKKATGNPSMVVVNGREFPATLQPADGRFHWANWQVTLPEAKVEVKLRPGDDGGLDCVLFARDPDYLPDYRDVTGPVWMRFRVLGEGGPKFHIDLYCVHTPYSAMGMLGDTACYLFRDQTTVHATEAERLAKQPDKLLERGQWSPWGRALHSRAYTWHSIVNFVSSERGKSLDNSRIEFEFASRPDESRVFGRGVEDGCRGGRLYVRMPARLDQSHLRRTESFAQWAERRFQMAQGLGFKGGEGPKTIVTGTMCDEPKSNAEMRSIMKTMNWLGINMLDVRFRDRPAVEEAFAQNGLKWVFGHNWVQGTGFGGKRVGELGYMDSVRHNLDASAEKEFSTFSCSRGDRLRDPWYFARLRHTVLGDEIGPSINSVSINGSERYEIPANAFRRGFFVEYLQRQGKDPAFFGWESWDEAVAIDYFRFHPLGVIKLEQAKEARDAKRAADQNFGQVEAITRGPDDELPTAAVQLEEPQPEPEKKAVLGDPATADLFEKRIHHHTQKFRSWATAMRFAAATRAIDRHLPKHLTSSANLQAMPVQIGRMWDGALNIFDLGRQNAFDSLQVEDWHGYHPHAAFGMSILKAAARKNGQPLAALVVGHNPGRRVITYLAQKVHTLAFYLYGPVHRIGPVWAEHPSTLQQIGDSLRLAARTEPDLLAADNRPADAAILIANTSEINAAYGAWGFAGERRAIYHSLIDAQWPVELVGEEEVIEDNALSRYRLLFVGDSHVDSRARKKIRQWVKRGGVLWASANAMIREEYDQPVDSFQDVFGIAGRAAPTPVPGKTSSAPSLATFRMLPTGGLPALEFKTPDPAPKFKLATATPLAQFEDGAPVMLENRFGKGRAFLCGFRLSAARGANAEDAGDKLFRSELVAVAARAAGVRPHLRADAPRLHAWVHDGPRQTVAFLINNRSAEVKKLPLTVVVPRPVTAAFSARANRAMPFSVEETGGVQLEVDLPRDGYDILVLRYAAD